MAQAAEDVLFREAFRSGWEEVREAARGGPSPSARWNAAVELVRRALSAVPPRPEPFRRGADVFERYRYVLGSSPVEVFVCALLDVKHRLLRDVRAASGILDGSLVHPREVFAPAVRERAAAVLLVHNHPSGDPAPSAEDREVTRRLRAAGGILGIPVLDHVIVGSSGFFSFREDGEW